MICVLFPPPISGLVLYGDCYRPGNVPQSTTHYPFKAIKQNIFPN